MFALSFSCENEAFGDDNCERDNEIARILRDLAKRMERDGATDGDTGVLRDSNGNKVGEWSYNGDD